MTEEELEIIRKRSRAYRDKLMKLTLLIFVFFGAISPAFIDGDFAKYFGIVASFLLVIHSGFWVFRGERRS
jgi:hypothetical protein